MSIQILEWEELAKLSLSEKNKILETINDIDTLSEIEIIFLDLSMEHLEDEYWECECCGIFFSVDSRNLRYDPTTCPKCNQNNRQDL